jgi:hypothetical protein
MTSSRQRESKSPMQPTLIRFDPEVLDAIRAEAERIGVSVARYVREATLARVSPTAAHPGDDAFDPEELRREAARMRAENRTLRAENAALRAENRQARRQAASLQARLGD